MCGFNKLLARPVALKPEHRTFRDLNAEAIPVNRQNSMWAHVEVMQIYRLELKRGVRASSPEVSFLGM